MRSVDANIVLRYILNDIREQSDKAAALFIDSDAGSLVVVDAVFFEVAWILQGPLYKFDRQSISVALEGICKLPSITCNKQTIYKALCLFQKFPKISFVDAYLSVYATQSGAIPLMTFDKNLAKALPESVNIL